MTTNLLSSLKTFLHPAPNTTPPLPPPATFATMAPADSNKRKRTAVDQGASRPSPSIHSAAEAAARAVAQAASTHTDVEQQVFDQILAHNNAANNDSQHAVGGGGGGGMAGGAPPVAGVGKTGHIPLTQYQVPASYELPPVAGPVGDAGASTGFHVDHQFHATLKDAVDGVGAPDTSLGADKPTVGSDAWHRIRRDNHKEVERRRREAINEGINELSKIVPGCEKNKGSILQRAVQYIGQLKENEQANIEKWTLEKLLLDQALDELSTSNDRAKADMDAIVAERDAYKRACEENGVEVNVEAKDEEKEK